MNLNELEISILQDIVDCHKGIYPELYKQLINLTVKEREFTGFGIYVNFDLNNQSDIFQELGDRKTYLSSPAEYYLNTLEHQISFELNISSTGKFEFLEIVPNGVEEWDGKYERFKKVTTEENSQ